MDLPPVLRDWAASRDIRLTPRASDGRVAFNVDDTYRIYIYPAPDNTLLLESRILDLEEDAGKREQTMLQALALATARMRNHVSRLTVDEHGSALLLQTDLRTDDGVQTLNDALTDFVNSLAAWRAGLKS